MQDFYPIISFRGFEGKDLKIKYLKKRVFHIAIPAIVLRKKKNKSKIQLF
jgi:hypothetical protein